MVGGGFVYAEDDFTSGSNIEGLSLDRSTAQIIVVSGQAKYFFGNSFYVGAGIGYRSLSMDITISETTTGDFFNFSVDGTAIVTDVTIGNMWSFDNGLYVGFDWIGFILPLTSSYELSTQSEGEFAALQEQLEAISNDTAQEINSTTLIALLVLNVGMMF